MCEYYKGRERMCVCVCVCIAMRCIRDEYKNLCNDIKLIAKRAFMNKNMSICVHVYAYSVTATTTMMTTDGAAAARERAL